MTPEYSGTPLPKKLGIGPGSRVAVLHDPGHAAALLAGSPPDAVLVFDPPIPRRPERENDEAFDVVAPLRRPAGGRDP